MDTKLNSTSNEYPLGTLLMGPATPKTRNTSSCFFKVFLVFGVEGPVESMPSGYSLDAEFNSASNEYPHEIFLMDPATPKIRNT